MIDESKFTKHYQAIAQAIVELIPIKWDKLVLYAEETGDSRSAEFYFFENGTNEIHHSGNIPEEFNTDEDIYLKKMRMLVKSIRGLWEEFKNADVITWKTITFSLDSNKKFKIKYNYDLNLEIGNYERQIRWAYDELGIIPKDSYSKKILDEYLKEKR